MTEADLRALPAALVGGPVTVHATSMWDVVERLRAIYCSTTGYDFAHIFVPDERQWLREAVETGRFRAPADPIDPVALLDRLTQVEVFERFLHRTFPGKTRFSIEGARHARADARRGDRRRGRSRRCARSSSGWRTAAGSTCWRTCSASRTRRSSPSSRIPFAHSSREMTLGWTRRREVPRRRAARDQRAARGGVRGVDGAQPEPPRGGQPGGRGHGARGRHRRVDGRARRRSTRASRCRSSSTATRRSRARASSPKRSTCAGCPATTTGGTIHIIANNQLGFTTEPRGVVQHAVRERPGARLQDPDRPRQRRRSGGLRRRRRGWRSPTASASRRDFLIDLVGYRRYGHNEGDEPAFTQPRDVRRRSRRIRRCARSGRGRWSSAGVVAAGRAEAMLAGAHGRAAARARRAGARAAICVEPLPEIAAARRGRRGATTAVPLERLRALNAALLTLPDGFTVHRKLERGREQRGARCSTRPDERDDRLGARPRSWRLRRSSRTACRIRLTGEDVERGTFSHRHAVLHDATTGGAHVPLQHAAAGAGRRSRSTTARSPRTRPSASSTATTCRRPSAS